MSSIKFGVVLPQTELGGTAVAVRGYASRVEEAGYDHLLAYDHVVGAADSVGPYGLGATYHEPLMLFAHLSAQTGLHFATAVMVLPQRQTVLIAKQVAELAILSDNRFRLGVGVGWNRPEYDALGASFGTRGRHLDEQVTLLRALWTQPHLTVHEEHAGPRSAISVEAGISPRPQVPVPIWVGGDSEAAYQRIGRIADGWFPKVEPGPDLLASLAVVSRSAELVGRNPATIGMEGRVSWAGDYGEAERSVEAWRAAGATHISIDTLGAGLVGVEAHADVVARLAERLPVTNRNPARQRKASKMIPTPLEQIGTIPRAPLTLTEGWGS